MQLIDKISNAMRNGASAVPTVYFVFALVGCGGDEPFDAMDISGIYKTVEHSNYSNSCSEGETPSENGKGFLITIQQDRSHAIVEGCGNCWPGESIEQLSIYAALELIDDEWKALSYSAYNCMGGSDNCTEIGRCILRFSQVTASSLSRDLLKIELRKYRMDVESPELWDDCNSELAAQYSRELPCVEREVIVAERLKL
jgi:hypothetical protein